MGSYFQENIFTLDGSWGWISQIFIIILVALTFNFIQKRVLRRVQKKLSVTSNHWDDAVVDALGAPLASLVWIVGITFAMHIAFEKTGTEIFSSFEPIRDVGVIACLVWFLIRLVNRLEQNLIRVRESAGKAIDRTTADALSKLVRISVIITGILVALQTLGFSVSGIMAFGGIGGIAVGFAAKDLLANFFGGLMIYLDRPFAVGDWIRSPDRNIEGTVEDIGWRLTCIRTFDKRPIYVPNSTFASITVENPSRMTHRRIYETIGLRYQDADKIARVLADIESMLKTHPDIDQSQTLMVNFNSYGPSSLDFFIYTFTKTIVWTEYHAVKQDVLLKVFNIISSCGADIAFPTTTINTTDDSPMTIVSSVK